MVNLSYILRSSDSHTKKAEQLKELIAYNTKKSRELLKKDELTRDEYRELEFIAKETSQILKTSLFKTIEKPFVKLVQEVDHNTKSLGLVELFSYDPTKKIEKEKGNYATVTNETVVCQQNKAAEFIIGSDPITVGLINDTAHYENPHVLKIKKTGLNYGLGVLHTAKIVDEYTVSAQFKLNRFPSKVYTQDIAKKGEAPKFLTKRLTSRRTDILALNYSTDGLSRIEFGAMAPNVRHGDISVYNNTYVPYSICASISTQGGKYTVYTDYKFDFKETQFVTLKITKVPSTSEQYINDFITAREDFINSGADFAIETFQYPKDGKRWGNKSSEIEIKFLQASLYSSFGDYARYTVSLSVNGVNEEIGGFYGKSWGSKAGRAGKKVHDMIASGPGFMPKEYREETRYSLSIKNAGIDWNGFLNHFQKTFTHTLNIEQNGDPITEDVIILSNINVNELNSVQNVMREWNDMSGASIRYTLTPYVWQSKSPVKHAVEQTPTFTRFDVTALHTITSAPGIINWSKNFADHEKYKRIYNRYNYRMNNGIDIGAIRIHAQILTEKAAEEAKKKVLIDAPE
jgi:hypothetical protein